MTTDGPDLDESVLRSEWRRTVLACRLGPSTTSVALGLSMAVGPDGRGASPGVALLAHQLELGEPTVRRALTALRDVGLIVRTERGSVASRRDQSDRYDLTIPDDLKDRVKVRETPQRPVKGEDRGGMANHVRWHERRHLVDPSCVHCMEGNLPVRSARPPHLSECPPSETALYRYWDADDRLIYVGITGDLHYRENSHICGSSWMVFVARSAVERFSTRHAALDAERVAITSERPLFNSKHNEGAEAVQRVVEYLIERGRADLLAPAVSRG